MKPNDLLVFHLKFKLGTKVVPHECRTPGVSFDHKALYRTLVVVTLNRYDMLTNGMVKIKLQNVYIHKKTMMSICLYPQEEDDKHIMHL